MLLIYLRKIASVYAEMSDEAISEQKRRRQRKRLLAVVTFREPGGHDNLIPSHAGIIVRVHVSSALAQRQSS